MENAMFSVYFVQFKNQIEEIVAIFVAVVLYDKNKLFLHNGFIENMF